MNTRILVILAMLCAAFGTAQAQEKPEVFPQLGHTSDVWSVVFSPDGHTLASSVGDEHTIKLWDVPTGRELRTLSGHTSSLPSFVFSPDRRILASYAVDGIKLWDVASGAELHTLGAGSEVFSVIFSPDGKVLASRDAKNAYTVNNFRYTTVTLWDVDSGRKLSTIGPEAIFSVVFLPDGHLLASSSRVGVDHTIKIWDVASGQELHTLSVGSKVRGLIFSPDGKILVSDDINDFYPWHTTAALWDVASGRKLGTLSDSEGFNGSFVFSQDAHMLASVVADNRTIKLWDMASGHELHTLSADYIVSFVAFSSDGKFLASRETNGAMATLWDVDSGRKLYTLSDPTRISSIAFSPDGKTLALVPHDHTIKLWDVASGRELRTLSGHAKDVKSVALTPDGKVLVSGNGDHTITLWDTVSGGALHTLTGHTDAVTSLAFSFDGKVLASGSLDRTIKLWEVATGRQLGSWLASSQGVTSVAYSRDGKMLASGALTDRIRLWDAASGQELRSLTDDAGGYVNSVAFSPDGKVLASANGNNTITLWDVDSGHELRSLKGHTGKGFVESVAFSPDGRVLASGGSDTTIRLWDVATGRELHTLVGHGNWIKSVAFSPDGKVLASSSEDDTVRLWDVESGRELRILSGHAGWVNSIVFASDGRRLVSGSADGTTRIWDLSSGSQLVSLVAFDDGSSLAITPEGFFDSSSAQAEEYLNVRVGDRVFGISSYRDKFYRPELVKLGLAGEPLTRFGSISGVKLAPVVELVDLPPSTGEPKLTVNLRITDGGGGMGLVIVFLNGTAIVQDDAAPPSGGPVMRSYTVQLANGPNALRAAVFNADHSMSASTVTATVSANLPAAPKGTLHAVVVGIQEFKNPTYNLTYPIKDAQLFADTLRAHSPSLFEKLDIKLLTTPAETDKDHVKQALTDMHSAAGPDDEFVFYVASHGSVADGEYYLITSNVGSAEPERLKADAMSSQELAGLLANVPAPKKLVIIDTCQAGALGDALQVALLTRGMNARTAATILSRGIGLTVLAAATTDEEALEGYRDHGLFTYIVADGLSGQAANATNGIVSNLGLAEYVGAEVPPLALNLYQHNQTPAVANNGARFEITKVK